MHNHLKKEVNLIRHKEDVGQASQTKKQISNSKKLESLYASLSSKNVEGDAHPPSQTWKGKQINPLDKEFNYKVHFYLLNKTRKAIFLFILSANDKTKIIY